MPKTKDYEEAISSFKNSIQKAKKQLDKSKKKIIELDINYAKLLIKEEIDSLKIAKSILIRKSKKVE